MPKLFINRRAFLSLFIGLWVVLIMVPLSGQYFGRNKVQYDTFNFKVMHTKHFDIYFYPKERNIAQHAARISERWYARLSRILDHDLKGRQILIIYSSAPHFQQTTAIPGMIGEGTGGVTEMLKRRIVLPLAASLKETNHVIGHELVHAFQFDLTSQSHSPYARAAPSARRLPLWFMEGLAEYLSLGPQDPHTAMWMRDALQKDRVPSIKKLTNTRRYFPYRYGQSLWAYITGEFGDEVVETIMKGVSRTGDYEAVIQKVTGASMEELSKGWKNSLKKNYKPLKEQTQIKTPSGRLLIEGTKENQLNVSPSISPQGENLVFLSTKNLFSIDMYLADAQSGEIKKRLTKTAVNPHFESLQFIKSSGSWDKQGERFVFGAVSRGDPVLSVFDIKKNHVIKEVKFPELGEILNPSWSPDGKNIVFSALVGGITDLFIYNLEKGSLRKLTDDPYADLYPSWSPDGRRIAFVTDRFSTSLTELNIGNYEMALFDLKSQKTQKISTFPEAKNINPQWSRDSESIYFLSDRNGISNIYRADLSKGEIYQITNLYTGVSGITGLSPAISVAKENGDLVYSLYEDGKYSLYSISSSELARMEKPVTRFERLNPSVLPPRDQPRGDVAELIRNPLYGLPRTQKYETNDYNPKLTLDYVAPPQVAIGVDRFGTYGGGGIAMFFSDVLGYHSLSTMAQVSSRIQDSSALVGYQYSKYRWNLGAVVQRIPYVTGGYSRSIDQVQGELASIEREYIFRQVNYQVQGLASYPFNQVNRFELSAGYRFLNFDREVYKRAYSLVSGIQLLREKQELSAPQSLHFGTAQAAFVYDSSFFGATSPILGQRYRFEVSPYIGTLTYQNILGDYRRYFMPLRPFTLAFRFLHYGRYGKDAEDERLYPLFLGYQSLVRGYNRGSFSAEECGSAENCYVFDRLFGSKMMVFNAELRFPVFKVIGIGEGYYGVFPLEFNAFFDSGIAWKNRDKAWFLGGERKPVSSTGFGFRANVMGYAVLGVYLVHPFNRPQKGWYFQFTFVPGF
ncbi:PD40 domain-containing protein [bacterium]|nr:PD40 domain-containing protein [bacterium]